MSGHSEQASVEFDHTVQTTVEAGEWVNLKEAAERTGLSQKTLRRYVKKKTVRTRRLGKSTNSPIQILLTPDLLSKKEIEEEDIIQEATVEASSDDYEQFFEEDEIDFVPESPHEEFEVRKEAFRAAIDECMKPLLSRIEEQAMMIAERDKEIEDKERQLKLLPDLEKQARERQQAAELKEFENQALKKQLELVAEEKRLKEEEYSLSKEELELLSKKEEELKEKLDFVSKEKEDSIKAREEELEKLKAELGEKDRVLAKLQKPWWKKWFLPQEPEQ